MANKTIEMNKIRLLLRLHARGCGKKSISARTGIARNTVKKYLLHIVSLRLTLDQVDQFNDHELSLLFTEGGQQLPVSSARYDSLEALFPGLEKQLKRKGITRQHLREQYRQKYSDGYGRSHFNHLLQDYIGRSHPVMHTPA